MKTFTSNCTLPPEVVAFVAVPTVRGSLTILWNCLSILVICTWSVIHVNVPTQSEPETRRQKWSRTALRLFWKTMWMLLNITAPEWPLGKAISDLQSVKAAERRLGELDEAKHWTRKHIFFANKGGFAIKFGDSTVLNADNSSTPNSLADQKPEKSQHESASTECVAMDISRIPEKDLFTHVHDLEMGKSEPLKDEPSDNGASKGENTRGLPAYILGALDLTSSAGRWYSVTSPEVLLERMVQKSRLIGPIDWDIDSTNVKRAKSALQTVNYNSFENNWEIERFKKVPRQWVQNLFLLAGNLWILDANQLLYAKEFGIIDQLPRISEEDIADRNKGDIFVKVIAVGQILWFIAELIIRLCQRLPTTQLEILTLSYAVCAFATYLALSAQPKDVQYSVTVHATRYPTSKDLIRLAVVGPTDFGPARTSVWIPNTGVHAKLKSKRPFSSVTWLAAGSSLGVLLLGALHLIAWNFHFPSEAERLYWNACSILATLIFPVGFIFDKVAAGVQRKWWSGQGSYHYAARKQLTIVLVLYFVSARLFVVVEALRSLAFQPPETFLTTFWANVPHIG